MEPVVYYNKKSLKIPKG